MNFHSVFKGHCIFSAHNFYFRKVNFSPGCIENSCYRISFKPVFINARYSHSMLCHFKAVGRLWRINKRSPGFLNKRFVVIKDNFYALQAIIIPCNAPYHKRIILAKNTVSGRLIQLNDRLIKLLIKRNVS